MPFEKVKRKLMARLRALSSIVEFGVKENTSLYDIIYSYNLYYDFERCYDLSLARLTESSTESSFRLTANVVLNVISYEREKGVTIVETNVAERTQQRQSIAEIAKKIVYSIKIVTFRDIKSCHALEIFLNKLQSSGCGSRRHNVVLQDQRRNIVSVDIYLDLVNIRESRAFFETGVADGGLKYRHSFSTSRIVELLTRLRCYLYYRPIHIETKDDYFLNNCVRNDISTSAGISNEEKYVSKDNHFGVCSICNVTKILSKLRVREFRPRARISDEAANVGFVCENCVTAWGTK